jgi:hypothetical protein
MGGGSSTNVPLQPPFGGGMSGSSVGAEGKPMCYDVVTIEPVTKRWSVSFYQDTRGDGSGFSLQNLALDLRVSD